jgi:hypothetical protein
MGSQSTSSAKGYGYIAAAIIVAAVLVSSSLIVVPLETTKTSTSTSTSVVTTTLPQVTLTTTRNFTTTLLSTTTVTIMSGQPSPCNTVPVALQGLPIPRGASPRATDPAATTIGTSIDGSATNSSSERKILTAAGRIWVFYTDGCNVVYQTSADGGNTWSKPPTVAKTGIGRGWFFTVAQNGTTLYFVVSASDGSTNGMIVFRYGTMNNDGTISWSIAEQDVPYNVGSGTVPTVAVDPSGNVWVAIETYSSSDSSSGGFPSGPVADREIEVFKSTTSAWSEVFHLGGLADYPRPILLALTSGKMALEILTETPGERQAVIYTTADGGATWSSPVTTPPDNILTLSSVSVGDTVYSVTSDTSGNIFLWTFTYGSSTFAGPTTLAKCCSDGYNDAAISTDGASFLFVAYSNSSSIIYETSTDLGASWTSPTAITATESQIQPGSLATNYLTSGVVSVVWTAQNGATSLPFNVRFASVAY